MSNGATKHDILVLKQQLDRIERELKEIKTMVKLILSRQD